MTDINVALDNIFSYKRNQRPVMARLVSEGYNVRGVGHLNIPVWNDELGIKGVIPFLGIVDTRKGTELAYYTAEREFSKEGSKLPAPFHNYNDCSYIHYGVLLNCLAYLSKTRASKLSLVVMETCQVMSFLIKPHIAELFLGNIGRFSHARVAAPGLNQTQTTLFQQKAA